MESLRYKDYEGSIDVSVEDRCLHGKLLFVDDLITYEGDTLDTLEKAFREAVDDYIALCSQVGKQPEKPYKGVFNVRIKPDLHRALASRAYRNDQTLNELVCVALEAYLSGNQVHHRHHHLHEHVVTQRSKQFLWTGDVSMASGEIETLMSLADVAEDSNDSAIIEDDPSWTLKIGNSVPC